MQYIVVVSLKKKSGKLHVESKAQKNHEMKIDNKIMIIDFSIIFSVDVHYYIRMQLILYMCYCFRGFQYTYGDRSKSPHGSMWKENSSQMEMKREISIWIIAESGNYEI